MLAKLGVDRPGCQVDAPVGAGDGHADGIAARMDR